MKRVLPILAVVVMIAACQTKPGLPLADSTATSSSTYTLPDDAAIKKAVDDVYASISFKKGDTPRYDSIKTHFTPKAQLINFHGDTLETLSIDQFVYVYRSTIEGDSIQMYTEKELYGKNEQFGRIASRISSYESFMNNADKPYQRGVNSFQLVKTTDGWKVSSIIWDVERKGLKIPGYYLQGK